MNTRQRSYALLSSSNVGSVAHLFFTARRRSRRYAYLGKQLCEHAAYATHEEPYDLPYFVRTRDLLKCTLVHHVAHGARGRALVFQVPPPCFYGIGVAQNIFFERDVGLLLQNPRVEYLAVFPYIKKQQAYAPQRSLCAARVDSAWWRQSRHSGRGGTTSVYIRRARGYRACIMY